MFWHAAGPIKGRKYDCTLYMRVNLNEMLREVMEVDEKFYCLCGDSRYNYRCYSEFLCQEANLNLYQTTLGVAMASGRVTVELMLKDLKQEFGTADIKRKTKLLDAAIGLLYLAYMLLSNCRACMYPNQTSLYFKRTPPSLK